ncbi:hypothetical protein ATZ33_13560 [Enterococcus silesiacus]|uniref:Uncharacterized protein n=1 Tax=Enterococcus silesiacus TaxID=332949 RepID=A0A0S3KDL6_9ENTE|nr:hypothetical protein [Enterococcus silesiacus]ALS02375.1 hypothetical protein ATZ33_13560 [Enterococcus silesiacus]OJG91350.1 hypothetical protein RV15_GL000806 [Enterococcus silesiacus]
MDDLLNLGGESYGDTISNLQQKITFESGLKEPNTAVLTLYKMQLADYQKKEKKRLQLVALRAKCVSKKNELQPELDQVKRQAVEKFFGATVHLEKITGSAGKMIEGNGGKIYSQAMSQLRLEVMPLSSMAERL